MTSEICYRPASTEDARGIAALVSAVFVSANVPGWSAEALSSVRDENAEMLLQAALPLSAYQRVAISGDKVVAYINFSKPHLLAIMAVSSELRAQGLGSRLIVDAVAHIDTSHPDVEVLQVSATERSMSFYAKHGFYPICPMLNVMDRRFVRMALWLRPRRMGW